jgi:hypothetical protein
MNKIENNIIYDLKRGRRFIFLSLFFVAFVAGIRFVNGGVLLAISSGATTNTNKFDTYSQFVWDSPLNILFLHILPAKILVIAIVYSVLAVIPAVVLFSRDNRLIWLGFATLFLTPAFKVLLGYIGSGDGVIVLMIILLVYVRSHYAVYFAMLIIGLWHPQQSFFIGISYLLARYSYYGRVHPVEVFGVFSGLLSAFFVFVCYRYALGFQYAGRETYMQLRMVSEFQKNIGLSPVAFVSIFLWFLLISPKIERGKVLLIVWFFMLAAISVVTTDVTRVFTIISLPFVLVGSDKIMEESYARSFKRIAFFAVMIALIPTLSWSRLDIFVWDNIAYEINKWVGG